MITQDGLAKRSSQWTAGVLLALALNACQPGSSQATDFRCQPASLKSGDVLTLQFPPNHGRELAVITPSKEYFFIVYTKPDRLSPLRSKMLAEDFALLSEYKINTTDFDAHPWREGAKEYKRVFTESGDYVFLLGDTLESDSTLDVSSCTVHFKK